MQSLCPSSNKNTMLSPIAFAVLWAERVIFKGFSIKILLDQKKNSLDFFSDKQKQQFFSNLYMLLRDWFKWEAMIRLLVNAPIPQRKKTLQLFIGLGLARLDAPKGPTTLILSSLLDALAPLHLSAYRKFVYALFHQFLKRKKELDGFPFEGQSKHLLPQWLFDYFSLELGVHRAEQVAEASAQRSPFWIRVVERFISKKAYIAYLMEKNIAFIDPQELTAPHALRILDPLAAHQLPQWEHGWIVVQDISSQRVVKLLEMALAPYAIKNSLHVLEFCAAPGSKTLQLLQTVTHFKLCSLEKNVDRGLELKKRLQEANVFSEVIIEDALEWSMGHPLRQFDGILVDAPCSATGVLARHPDAKWSKNIQDFSELEQLQYKLLRAAWTHLKPNGWLLYSTCSILPQENFKQISQFLLEHPEARCKNFREFPEIQKDFLNCSEKDWCQFTETGLQIFPSKSKGDGFFYSLVQKQSGFRPDIHVPSLMIDK